MFHSCSDTTSRRRLAHVRTQMEAAAEQARDKLIPLAEVAEQAIDRLAPLAGAAAQKAKPVVDGAIAKVTDVVDTDVLPRLTEWRDQAAPRLAELRDQATPRLEEAAVRSRRAVAALKGETPPVPVPKKRHPVIKAIIVATIVGAVLLLLRALLDARDEGWELEDVVFDETTDEAPTSDQAPASDQADADASPADADPLRYGEGSYIGAEPPAGYDIKGNERSMKYHVPTALGYERCVTDIWFNSPEAAERAGFTRALR